MDNFNNNSTKILNLAHYQIGVKSLGPGKRAVVWVQGCPFSCSGCIAPDWRLYKQGQQIFPENLAKILLEDDEITGLTFSGGEPMEQAEGLAQLAKYSKNIRAIDIICFTGFPYAQLKSNPPNPGVLELLKEIDVLIDGLYTSKLNNNRGLMGSTNQQVFHFTNRLQGFDFEGSSRKLEISINRGEIIFAGIPPHEIMENIENRISPYLLKQTPSTEEIL